MQNNINKISQTLSSQVAQEIGLLSGLGGQEIDKDKYGSYFSSFALESTSINTKSRLGWCYGDLGIASVLYQAGKVLNEDSWIDKQFDSMDCGATCLAMVAKYYGKNYSIQKLREMCSATRAGVSMLGISDAAEKLG